MTKGFLVACILTVLFGCAAFEDKIQDVHKGATKNQVITFLGKPDESVRSGIYEALRYTNRPDSAGQPVGSDYIVILQGGSVVEYGYGYFKQRDPSVTNRLILVPPK
jgi:hypothetical protein